MTARLTRIRRAEGHRELAGTFEESIARTVEAVEQTLLFLREEYQEDQAVSGQQAWAEGHSFPERSACADLDGRPRWPATWTNLGPVDPNVNIADREHFRVQKASTDDVLFISQPLIGRQSNKLSIQFVRKLLAPDGRSTVSRWCRWIRTISHGFTSRSPLATGPSSSPRPTAPCWPAHRPPAR